LTVCKSCLGNVIDGQCYGTCAFRCPFCDELTDYHKPHSYEVNTFEGLPYKSMGSIRKHAQYGKCYNGSHIHTKRGRKYHRCRDGNTLFMLKFDNGDIYLDQRDGLGWIKIEMRKVRRK
jgi:hypothetical protein